MKMYFVKNMSFVKFSGQTVSIAVFSVFVYIFKYGAKIVFDIFFGKVSFFCIIFVLNHLFEKRFGHLLLIWSIQSLPEMCENFWIDHIHKRTPTSFSKTRFTLCVCSTGTSLPGLRCRPSRHLRGETPLQLEFTSADRPRRHVGLIHLRRASQHRSANAQVAHSVKPMKPRPYASKASFLFIYQCTQVPRGSQPP